MRIGEDQLRDFIVDSGLVSIGDIVDAEKEAAAQDRGLVAALVARGRLSPDEARRIEANALGVSFVDLKDKALDIGVLSLIPEPLSRNRNIVAFKKAPGSLEVALLDMSDLEAIDFMRRDLGLRILPRLTDAGSMKSALLHYQKGLRAEFGDTIKRETESLSALGDDADIRAVAAEVPVVRLVDALLRHAIMQGVSDIHLEPRESELAIRYRIGGSLHDAMTLPSRAAPLIAARIRMLSGLEPKGAGLPEEGHFRVEMNGEETSLGVVTTPTMTGEKVVIRVTRSGGIGSALEALGFHSAALEAIHDAVKRARGLILVAGPKDSGKAETLYALTEMFDRPSVDVASVEERSLRVIPRVAQTLVRPDIGFSYAAALRSVLRQDADVVMVGDIADGATAALTVNAAQNGRMILAGIDARSSAGAMVRLAGMKVEPLALASNVSVVVNCRLVRRLAGASARKALSKSELNVLGKAVNLDRMLSLLRTEKAIGPTDSWDKVLFSSSTAYRGHIGIHEVLPISSAIQSLIARSAKAAEIEAAARREGAITLVEDGILAAARGLTTIEEVLRAASE